MHYRDRIFSTLLSAFVILTFGLTMSCSAQTEDQALKSLRDLSKDDKLPPEDLVAGIESRFAGRKAGALAKLLHARIRFENNDFAGAAAALLNTDVIAKQTRLGDYALWLRGPRFTYSRTIHARPAPSFSTFRTISEFNTRSRCNYWAGDSCIAEAGIRSAEILR